MYKFIIFTIQNIFNPKSMRILFVRIAENTD